MDKEYYYLIKIIRSVLNNEKLVIEDDISYNKLFSIARNHSVGDFLYYGLYNNNDFDKIKYKDFLNILIIDHKNSLFKVATQSAEIEEICNCFEQNKIKYMPLKGVILRNLYPSIDLRSMADFDCYIDKTKVKDVKKILLNLGYDNETYNKGNHDVYYKAPFMNVEIHKELMNESYKISKYYKNIDSKLKQVKKTNYQYEMTKDDFFIFMILHLAKHFANGGTGIRSFIDIYLYINKYQDLNYDYIFKELDSCGMVTFCKGVINLSNYWFGNNIKLMYSDMEEYVFKSGTYGTVINNTINKLIDEEGLNNLEKSKTKYVLKRLFPSIKVMNARNPITKKVPILLPFFYVTRLFKGIFNIKRNKSELDGLNNVSNENINKQKELNNNLDMKGKI